jgi:hypothetical protein
MAVRAYSRPSEEAEGEGEDSPRAASAVRRRYPHEALVFDTETLVEPAQRLLFGVWRFYRDGPDEEPGRFLVEEGIFYPDELPERDPEGFAHLRAYVEDPAHPSAAESSLGRPGSTERRLRLVPVSQWMEERLYRYAYRHRDRCALVAFNLPFDLGRLARYWSPAIGRFRGGWSLGLWGDFDEDGTWKDARYHPRLLLKAIDPRRTLYRWGSLKRGDDDGLGTGGRFVDLRTLVFALTDRSATLERACELFGDPFAKAPVEYGVISSELIAYALDDLSHTALLYRACLAELREHPGVTLEPHGLYSPATVGTQYLKAMGVDPPRDKFAELDPGLYGRAMSAFFGGRAEARIVRTPVPIVHVDFTSMYPSVNALLGTWDLLSAGAVRIEDAREDVGDLLRAPDLAERLLERGTWAERIGVTLCEIEDPSGAVLPVRARYGGPEEDFGIGVNPLYYEGRLWYMLPDLLASRLLCGAAVRVVQALRLAPEGRQRGLQPVKLRGGSGVDPARRDPFVAMIGERHRLKANERVERFLKITANATAYGVLARFDRHERASERPVLQVLGPDAEVISFPTRHPEEPGPYCFPPAAASITAAARLMLALLEREVAAAGGAYAFCDTDSMAIVASPQGGRVPCRTPDGANELRALSWEQVREIQDRFEALHPYERTAVRQPLVMEQHGSLDEELWCYAISAKRYALYRLDPRGRPRLVDASDEAEAADDEAGERNGESGALVDWSEHGLGMYLDPLDPGSPRPQKGKRRLWTRQAWQWILAAAHGVPVEMPAWVDTLALARFTVSGPRQAGWFAAYDAAVPFEERIRPASFGVLGQVHGLAEGLAGRLSPAGPYESDPSRWGGMGWYDRGAGGPVDVIPHGPGADPAGFAEALAGGAVPLRTLRAVLASFRDRPERKSLGPDGGPVGPETQGLLLRRPVHSAYELTDLIGKEGNRIDERSSGEVTEVEEYQHTYGARADRFWTLVVPTLAPLGPVEVARRSGLTRDQMRRIFRREIVSPHGSTQRKLLRVAVEHAAAELERFGLPVSPDSWVLLYALGRARG